jgi:hypothetical protein
MSGCTQRSWPQIFLVAVYFVGSACLAQDKADTTASHKEESPGKKTGFAEFQERVQAYEKLRSELQQGIPPVHRKDTPEQIQKHEQALAQKIADARKEAKPGDIFTDNAKQAFLDEIQKVFAGKHARAIRRTIVQGSPVRVELYVNKRYPDTIPVTTVPPTLLEHLPRLPKQMEYRIVGDSLVLEDLESRLVVDIFAGAFPDAPPH